MRQSFLLALASLLFQVSLYAQIESNDWIVKLTPSSFKAFDSYSAAYKATDDTWFHSSRVLSKRLQLVQIETTVVISEQEFKEQFSHLDLIRFYPNAKLENRDTRPDDELYEQQWNMEMINMPQVWDFATGGKTANGDDIVVAVLDDGFEIEHDDLENNLWENPNEIPNDGLDNDGNGYKDDYHGLNIDTEDGNIEPAHHGTRVAGIVGAQGNNEEGITGVNWDVKLLPVGGIDLITEIIQAMDYIIELKEAYLVSDGERGANILVSNLSQGKGRTFPETHIDWCDLYEEAGKVGILSVGAAPNSFYNVDVEGDLPSLCESESLIIVTNTDRNDLMVREAAVGPIHIDLGAPGEVVLSTYLDNSYETIKGTSASAPLVCGVAALLYSTCEKLADLTKTDPQAATLVVKDAILQGVTPISSLENTVSGGRLDAYQAFLNISGYCTDQVKRELKIISLVQHGESLLVEFDTNRFDGHQFVLTDAVGRTIKTLDIRPALFSLPQYEFEVEGLIDGYYVLSVQNETAISSMPFIYFEN